MSATTKQRTVDEITNEDLVKRAVRNARPHQLGDAPRWVAVMDTFALGSTFAYQLCRLHDLDPDEIVTGTHCDRCDEESEVGDDDL